MITAATGRPVHGVLPFHPDVWLDAEDSLAYGRVLGRPGPPRGSEWLRVAVVRLPRISNATDAEALAAEPGVAVRYVTEPSRLTDADLVVLPGSKSTVSDLAWLRRTGLADAVSAHAHAGRPVLGICGGYQMLGKRIVDPHVVEGGDADGLGLLDLEVEFDAEKHLGNPTGTAWGEQVGGYEIHHGRVVRSGDPSLLDGEGSDAGAVLGTHWHGLLENDGFRRVLLRRVAAQAGRTGFVPAPDTSFAAHRAAQLDVLADLVEQHLDVRALEHVINHGVPAGLPMVTTGLAVSPG
jgi:adenosylcobyric acid synthase